MVATGAQLEGRYRVERLLAQGGMGSVYLGVDEVLERPVAIKALVAGTGDRRRFEVESRLLSGLRHPHLVQLFDAGEDDGTAFLVLEYVDGPSLATVMADGPLPPSKAATIATGVADALAYVHAQGIVHRDVKPANILLPANERALLSDFGIARLVDMTRLTASGSVLGTAAYMAPEQVRGDPVTAAADVYALGLVLLECVSGERAFRGELHEAALARLIRDPAVPARLPLAWQQLVTAMTAREPQARPSAVAAAAQLRHLASATPALEPTVPGVATTAPLAAPPIGLARWGGRPLRRWAAALALTALAAVVGASVLGRNGSEARDPRSPPAAPSMGNSSTLTTATGPSTTSPTTSAPAGAAGGVNCGALDALEELLDQRKDANDEGRHDKAQRDRIKDRLDAEKDALEAQRDQCE